jgi:tetrahydromethanopterin S-methyltransferase subunit G
VKKTVERIGLVAKSDFDALQQRFDELEKKLATKE